MNLYLLGILYSLGILNLGSTEPGTDHAIYVSVLEVEQESIMVKVFANDLEDAIFNQSQQRVDLINGDCRQSKTLISNYFNDHLKIKIDGKEQSYSYVSCELNDISLWMSFTFTSPATWREVEVTADYLMELFPTQSNVVSITYLSNKKMFRLTREATTETISF
jgi:hypothetical protein